MNKKASWALAALLLVASVVLLGTSAAAAFADVPADAWYSNDVNKAQALKLVSGYDDGNFHPNDTITRGQFVQILYNKYGEPPAKKSKFTDVPADAWYYDAISWASETGIVSGTGNKKFMPDGTLTREQMATILYAIAGRPTMNTNQYLAKYLDYSNVSSWATSGMAWCVKAGIIKGTTETSLNPQGTTTRAEAATIMVRLVTSR